MKISYDAEVDALYIQFRAIGSGQAENRDLGPGVTMDFGPDGLPVGLEILNASKIMDKDNEQITVQLAPMRHKAA